MSEPHQITLKLEGPPSQDGHVLLADLVDELRLLEQGLSRIDRIVDEKGEAALEYKVVAATHSSPLMFVFEPTAKRNVTNPGERIQATHSRFFQEIGDIQRGISPSNDIDTETLNILKRMVTKPGVSSVVIKNGHGEVKLDEQFEHNLNRLLRDEEVSRGTLIGKLEALNIHGKSNSFWLYPAIGPLRVLCKFQAGTKDKVKAAIDRYVEARGVKYYRVNCQFPYKMMVVEFEILDESQAETLATIRGIAKDDTPMASASSAELINLARDEWE